MLANSWSVNPVTHSEMGNNPRTESNAPSQSAYTSSDDTEDRESQQSPDGVWNFIDESDEAGLVRHTQAPQSYRAVRLDQESLSALLAEAPVEFTQSAKEIAPQVSLPMPNGMFATFQIEESAIMEPGLAEKFPLIKTYRGQGIDDPASSARLDITPAGLHAVIFSERGAVYIDPLSTTDTSSYMTYHRSDYKKAGEEFQCYFSDSDDVQTQSLEYLPSSVSSGAVLRTYRLACAATGEYTQYFGGTRSQGLSAIVTTINRVNAIFEKELAVRLLLVSNNDLIVYTNPTADPYTNNDGSAMLSQNQSNLDAVIGSANYDIGHVFSTAGGGLAYRGAVCNSAVKAYGVTGLTNPVGDTFAVDYVCHEIGHQFGARHTFNGSMGSCGGGNRSSIAAYEPGSGSTIMSYAGICGSQNLQSNADPYFHVKSLEEIIAFLNGTADGCSAKLITSNQPPTASAGQSFTIPAGTPFTLTASGSDTDGDALTYSWEEYDLGAAAPPDTDGDGQARPIFRSFLPTSSPSRTFPRLESILNNTVSTGESLPTIDRAMNFQVTVRDNRAGGGGINTASAQVTVDGDSGPFVVTQPNTAVNWTAGSQQIITWDVAGTNLSPVSATSVRITLSTDGGQSFPITLAASTANDGAQTVTLPNTTTTSARIRIEAVGNIFFDISDANFTISGSSPTCSASISPASQSFSDGGGEGSVSVTVDGGCSWTATTTSSFITITSGAEGSGSGTVRYLVAPNSSTSQRSGTINIGTRSLTVTQAATSCLVSISSTTRSFSASSGTGNVGVQASSSCYWSAQSTVSWITITANGSGPGSKTLKYSVSQNTGTQQRTGTIVINGQVYTVVQSGVPCSFSLSASSASISSNGGSSAVNISTSSVCEWSASSSASFIVITSSVNGSGSGAVSFYVYPNSSAASRTGTMTIAGQTFTVTQAGTSSGCSYSVSPTSQSATASTGSGTVSVSAGAGCSWTAASNASFITITSGASGSGSGIVSYSITSNPSTSPRTGTMTVAGQTITVTQAGAVSCSYSISSQSASYKRAGGNGSISVTAAGGCGWSASSNVSWITISSGESGSGNGQVIYTIDVNNTGKTRSGTMTIAGKTFSVKQTAF